MPYQVKNNKKRPVLLITAILACAVSFIVFIFSLSSTNKQDQVFAGQAFYADQVVARVNEERVKKGIKPLIVNKELSKAAQNKANHMAENNYFAHISLKDGKKWSDFIKESGYVYSQAGENLANGFEDVDEMTKAWMNSTLHRENILDEGFLETGIGYAQGELNGQETLFVAQVFGTQKGSASGVMNLFKVSNVETLSVSEGSLLSLVTEFKSRGD